jgi:hypothetical protein
MNQTVLKQPLEGSTSGLIDNNVTMLREVKHAEIQARIKAANMLRQHLIGILILVIGIATALVTKELTALIMLAPFSILTFISKNYIFINKKRGKEYVHRQ